MEDLPTKFSLNVEATAGAAAGAAGTTAAVSCGRSSIPLNYVNDSNHLEHASDNCTVGTKSLASSSNHRTSSWLAALHVRNNNTNANHSHNGQAEISVPMSVSNPSLEQRCTHKSQSVWECFTCSCQTISLAKMKHTLTETNGASSSLNMDPMSVNGGGGDGSDLDAAITVEKLSSVSDKFYGTTNNGTGGNISNRDDSASSLLPLGNDYDDNQNDDDGENDDGAFDICGAVSLSHIRHHRTAFIDDEEVAAAAAVAIMDEDDGFSNRTSLNNSTENLSYTSDNFYGDEVLLLGDEGGAGDAEELSLNSDDCIYAYRGEGADFDLSTQRLTDRNRGFSGANSNNGADEETDFLEMDFEPDPSSELEYNTHSIPLHANMNINPNLITITDGFMKQRDNCHLSTPLHRQQIFSSPTESLPTTKKALQNQSLLTKNFARINLHLDQIQKDYCDEHADELRERLNSISEGRSRLIENKLPTSSSNEHDTLNSTAHSLPNVPHEHFARTIANNSDLSALATSVMGSESLMQPLNQSLVVTPQLYKAMATITTSSSSTSSKMTGAKPKRLSTFSSTSSTSSKNSSKSRASLKSSLNAMALGNNNTNITNNNCNFDERSASCNEFRSEYDLPPSISRNLPVAPHTAPSTGTILGPTYNVVNDDICLDCLEKEFLASTIGKTLDPSQDCVRCRKRLGNLLVHNNNSGSSLLRHSISPGSSFFPNIEQTSPTSKLFPFERVHLIQDSQLSDWDVYPDENPYEIHETCSPLSRSNQSLQHSLLKSDSKLLIEVKPPDSAMITIPTKDLTELCLIQAMDKMKIPYNREILLRYFQKENNKACDGTVDSSVVYQTKSSPPKDFSNLLHFLLHISKSQCNYSKLKSLVEESSKHKLTIKFKMDKSNKRTEMIPVKVTDILHQWSRCKNLEVLKKLDQRFSNLNILGKIANIVRQAHQRCTTPRRPMPEFLPIPQYYPNGFLILTSNTIVKSSDREQ